MKAIKWLGILAVLAAAGWSAWWFVGAQGQERGIAHWLDLQQDRGWLAEAGTIEVSGFPTQFNLEMRDIHLSDPRTGWAWKAPDLRADSDASTPTRIAVTWPQQSTIGVPRDNIQIQSERMQTLLDLRPGPSMELRQAASDIKALSIAARSGWRAGADSMDLNLTERPDDLGPEHSYDLDVVAVKLSLPKEIVAAIDPTGWLRPKIDRFTIKGHGAFDDALNRNTVEQGRLSLRAATIREAGFEWGDMRLFARGAFTVNDDGFPEGQIEIEAREWRQMIRLAVNAGVIDSDTARTITRGIEILTALTGGGKNLVAPIGLSGGKVRIGPIPVADAPQLAPPR